MKMFCRNIDTCVYEPIPEQVEPEIDSFLESFPESEEELRSELKDSIFYCFEPAIGGFLVSTLGLQHEKKMYLDEKSFFELVAPFMKRSIFPPREIDQVKDIIYVPNVSFSVVKRIMKVVQELKAIGALPPKEEAIELDYKPLARKVAALSGSAQLFLVSKSLIKRGVTGFWDGPCSIPEPHSDPPTSLPRQNRMDRFADYCDLKNRPTTRHSRMRDSVQRDQPDAHPTSARNDSGMQTAGFQGSASTAPAGIRPTVRFNVCNPESDQASPQAKIVSPPNAASQGGHIFVPPFPPPNTGSSPTVALQARPRLHSDTGTQARGGARPKTSSPPPQSRGVLPQQKPQADQCRPGLVKPRQDPYRGPQGSSRNYQIPPRFVGKKRRGRGRGS